MIVKTRMNVKMNSAAESGPKDYISEVSESSLGASIRDYFTPSDILVLRTAGSKWNNAKLYGEFAALWFFLMTKDGSKWPSMCSDYRQSSGFGKGMFEPGRLPDLTAFGNSGEWTVAGIEEPRGVQSKTSPATCVLQHVTN